MVTEDEELICRKRPALLLIGIRFTIAEYVELAQECPIDSHPVWTNRHRLAWESDHALDIWGVVAA